MYGLCNEPQYNFDGALDADVWTAMNDTVAAIREVEADVGAPQPHLVSVQGTGGWSRFLQYYVDHPITAGGGENVLYEVHVYDPASEFASRFEEPAETLPVIIGEYGEEDVDQLFTRADAAQVPHLAWTFHPRCPPNLLVDNSDGGCGVDMALESTSWGDLVKGHLAGDW